ncbi:MAG: NADH-quinone oxidoreductase subunit H [Euryarchaeota archaeon]|nr:NADH-quinone oxidoreductase subunit H [Euryarchaeota archaeon]
MILSSIAILLLGPLLVGISMGLDRKITARLQNRRGPPLLQPFYDIGKLLSKQSLVLSDLQALFASFSLIFHIIAFALFAFGGNLLVIFFISSMGAIFLVLGAYSTPSPYSHLGANRELLAMLAYEPILFLAVIAIGMQGSFLVGEIVPGLLSHIPLILIALLPVLVILLEKSPFDVPTAHQELVTGPYVEYSGPYLALLELGHWYQLAFVYGMITLFIWGTGITSDIILKLVLAFILLFAAILIDNITARLTRKSMVAFMLTVGIGLIALNLLILYIIEVI